MNISICLFEVFCCMRLVDGQFGVSWMLFVIAVICAGMRLCAAMRDKEGNGKTDDEDEACWCMCMYLYL